MVRRFKPAQPSTHSDHAQEPGPGQYIDPDIISKDNKKLMYLHNGSYVFRSKNCRDLFCEKRTQNPGSGHYKQDNFTIQDKILGQRTNKKKQPFISGQPRFKSQSTTSSNECEDLQEVFVPLAEFSRTQKVPFNSNVK